MSDAVEVHFFTRTLAEFKNLEYYIDKVAGPSGRLAGLAKIPVPLEVQKKLLKNQWEVMKVVECKGPDIQVVSPVPARGGKKMEDAKGCYSVEPKEGSRSVALAVHYRTVENMQQ